MTLTGPSGVVITKLSPWSIGETLARLSAVVVAREMKIFEVIDHSGEASAVGLRLRDTKLVIFGSAQAGTPVMVAQPLSGLDLPLKVLVWEDGLQTKVSYVAAAALAARYNLPDELVARLTGVDSVTNAVINR